MAQRSKVQDLLADQLTVLQSISNLTFEESEEVPFEMERTITNILLVSAHGDNSDGLTWDTAFTTVNTAVAAAGANDVTAVAIDEGMYDVDLNPGLPVEKRICFIGAGHGVTFLTNSNADNEYVLSCSEPCYFKAITFYRTGSCDGLRLVDGSTGSYLSDVYFAFGIGEGAPGRALLVQQCNGAYCENMLILGDTEFTSGILIDRSAYGEYNNVRMCNTALGLQIGNEISDGNLFRNLYFCGNTLAIDINGGNVQHFIHVDFHGNAVNIDDEIKDSVWEDIHGDFNVTLTPDDFTGIVVATHANPDTYGADVELVAVGDYPAGPFKILAIHIEGDAAEKFKARISADNGVTFFDVQMIEGEVNAVKRQASVAPIGTDRIWNSGTRISASSKSETGLNNVWIWLEIQSYA